MSCHLHVLAVSTCNDYSKWRFHNIKSTEAVLVVLSVVNDSLQERHCTGNCEQRDNKKESSMALNNG